MSPEELKTRVRQAFEAAFNRGNLDALDEMSSPNVLDQSVARTAEQTGLEGFKQRIAGHRAGFSDLQITIHEMLVDQDMVAFRWTMSGTQDGSWQGRPPTGKKMTMPGMNMERLEDGKIVEHWSNPNILSAFMQLGFIPSPGQS
jgi:steroid delta-isomerase-like uncharacterized protein